MDYHWLYLPTLAFFLLGTLGGIYEIRKKARMQLYQDYCKVEERCIRALDSASISKVSDAINEWQVAFEQAESVLSNVERSLFATDMEDLRCHLSDLEKENWLKKAEKHLDTFSECYEIIVDGAMENFKDVDQLFNLKSRCISAWQSYFHIDLEQYATTIYPKRYLREYMGELYDPCMESHDALEKKLSDRIRIMRPEYQRKMKLRSLIIQKIADQGTVQRSHLLKADFDGFVAGEINICYKGLVKEHAVVEYKQGSLYFVILSDATAKKYPPKKKTNQNPEKEKPQPVRAEEKEVKGNSLIASRTELLYRELIRHFDEENIEYVDKTVNGGGLYIFDESIANDLKSKGFESRFAKNGTKGTGHRPAWYIKI